MNEADNPESFSTNERYAMFYTKDLRIQSLLPPFWKESNNTARTMMAPLISCWK